MRKFRTLATVGVMSVAGLGLIGVGAHAVFTQNTTSQQAITAGVMNVTLSSSGVGDTGQNTPTLTIAPLTGVGSTFMTAADEITITNNSPFPVTEVALQLSDVNNNATLQGETWACFYSDSELLVNEPLTTVEGYGAAVVGGGIAAGGTDTYTAIFYAGAIDTGCGPAFTGFSGSAYTSYEGYAGTPAFGGNPGAASLTNGAEGGTVVPMVTLTYNG